MKLLCRMMFAGLVFTAVASTATAQMVTEKRATPVRPFLTLVVGPSSTSSKLDSKSARPAPELTVGARKRLGNRFGVSVAAHAGKTIEPVLGAEDAYCKTLVIDGQHTSCVPHVPLLNWYAGSIGAEAYLGRAILSLSTGPASFGTNGHYREAMKVENKSMRGVGMRTQFESIFPVYRSVGLSASVAYRSVPEVISNRMSVTSFGLGLTLR